LIPQLPEGDLTAAGGDLRIVQIRNFTCDTATTMAMLSGEVTPVLLIRRTTGNGTTRPRKAATLMPPAKGHRRQSRRKDANPPRTGADEKSTLLGFLDYLREAIAAKVRDAPEPQVRTAGVPSGTSVLGLVKHLTFVERFYFLGEDVRDWAATMRPGPQETVADVLAAYRAAIEQANAVIAECADLTQQAPRPARRASAPSMRWVLVHMIEETGRHAGHADILREQIDGSTGR
jgi:hypothetical protein